MCSKGQDVDSDSESSSSDVLDLKNEEGWEDMEDDTEAITVVSLFDDRTFTSAKEMLQHCKDKHGFDIWKIQIDHSLDFIGQIKLVNYIRSEVKSGNLKPDTSTPDNFNNDKYLQPVLEDDALLYSLDDVFDEPTANTSNGTQSEIDQLREQLSQLTTQFQAYREEVQRSLLQDLETTQSTTSTNPSEPQPTQRNAVDTSYFDSYSYNTIHELMLKDTIRTDTYRDFTYDNKHLFTKATVLDVGCGTGILSLFSARAGASHVYAVDNSTIIHKARENIFRNKLDKIISCHHGQIEDPSTLPISTTTTTNSSPKKVVDILISEWMGYCLLYESMLDSVLAARDLYLNPLSGLMVPSHATISLAPLGSPSLRESHIDFWRDVYNFDMTAMLEKAHEEALIRVVNPSELAGPAATILDLDLHTCTVADLSFTSPFTLTWTAGGEAEAATADDEGHDTLEGFVLWFDTPFATSRDPQQAGPRDKWLNLSTSPSTTSTHWQQGVLLIKDPAQRLKMAKGDEVKGTITYRKREGERGLDIDVTWGESGRQTWAVV